MGLPGCATCAPPARGGGARARPPGPGTTIPRAVRPASARDVVRNHGGVLTVTDAPGGGAAFLVTLPRAPLDAGGDRV
ncbi:MAG: HAMP domain-containing histidine kinase [Streptomyces sp.]|uniref:hypothetical protein n=1 Tax=Streptomyces sp. TaxID=1931 RepID=UPI0025EF85A7|nr:hypothetical protein [Streptomyces sp.]MBW8793403.1 HAMP domain-containing histidine kinase [Streptomyces sp.]